MNLIPSLRLALDHSAPDVVALVGAGGKTTTLFRLAQEITAAGKCVVSTTTTRLSADQARLAPALFPLVGSGIDWRALARSVQRHRHVLLVREIAGAKAIGVPPEIVDQLARRAGDLGLHAILVEADGSRGRPVKAPADHEPVVASSTTLQIPVLGVNGIGLPVAEPHVHRPHLMRALLQLPAHSAPPLTPALATRLLAHPQGGARGMGPSTRLLPLLNPVLTPPQLASARLIASLLAAQGIPSLLGAVGEDNEPIRERWGPVTVVVLAAGRSSRMGRPKQLLELDGEPLVARAVRRARTAGASRVVVVVGAHAAGVRAALAELSDDRLVLIENGAWASGQASSVRAAIAALDPAAQAALFLPVDQPDLSAVLLARLQRLWRRGADLAAPRVQGELRGAPAIFDRRYFPELSRLAGDRGAGPLLQQHRNKVATISVSPAELRDVDTLEQWHTYTGARDGS